MTSTEATLQKTHEIFSELRAYAETEAKLLPFVPVLVELEDQARRLAAGATSVSPLVAATPPTMPSRDIAVKVTEIVSKLPPVEDDFDDTKAILLARLLDNLVVAITGTIFAQYPDVIPHE